MTVGYGQRYVCRMAEKWPDLAVLELLVAVAELGSLSGAAARVGMTQPSASRALARFERRLGLTLLQRTTRGSALTAHGAIYVDWSRDVLAAAEQLVVATTALRSGSSGTLRIAASMTVAEYLVPRWLAEFRRTHEEVEVTLGVVNSDAVAQAVRGGQAEVGFVETAQAPAGLRTTTVARDRLLVVVAPSHPWARRTRALPADLLAATPLVLREPGSGTRRTLVSACADVGLALADPVQELASNTAVRVAAMSGAGPAVLSELAVGEQLGNGSLVAVRVSGLEMSRELRACWAGGAQPVGLAADLLAIAARGPAAQAALGDTGPNEHFIGTPPPSPRR